MPTLRVIGTGRAGSSLGRALAGRGWEVREPLARGSDLRAALHGVDLLVVATPDAAIAGVAAQVERDEHGVIAHLAGSQGLGVLAPHVRRASLHPLVALPDAGLGAERLTSGAWFAVAGDALARRTVEALGGRCFEVPDERRTLYHAAACIASNHLVALLGQVERVAQAAGVPLEAYLELVRETVANVAALGPARALTGPAARGDSETLARHRAALAADELPAYDALLAAARRLL